jgi:hypothetical protein
MATLVLAVVAWWLAGLTPRWYQPAGPEDGAALQLGEAAEYRLVEEFQKIRPADTPWRLRIPEDAINAWLTARLPQWLAGQGVAWPPELGPPQIRMTPAGIELALASDDLGGRVGRLHVAPTIHGNQLTLPPPALRLGRLPLRLPFAWIRPDVEEAVGQTEALRFLATLLQGGRIEATVPLADNRHVRLRAITWEPHACVIEADTQPGRPGE